jgi:hypothetical protein
MINQVAIVTRIEAIELKASNVVFIGRGVRITQENKGELFKEYGIGVDSLAGNGPKSNIQLDDKIDNCFIGVGKLKFPETFNINFTDKSLIFHRPALDNDSPMKHDVAVEVLKQFQAKGGKVIYDALNFLMHGA